MVKSHQAKVQVPSTSPKKDSCINDVMLKELPNLRVPCQLLCGSCAVKVQGGSAMMTWSKYPKVATKRSLLSIFYIMKNQNRFLFLLDVANRILRSDPRTTKKTTHQLLLQKRGPQGPRFLLDGANGLRPTSCEDIFSLTSNRFFVKGIGLPWSDYSKSMGFTHLRSNWPTRGPFEARYCCDFWRPSLLHRRDCTSTFCDQLGLMQHGKILQNVRIHDPRISMNTPCYGK